MDRVRIIKAFLNEGFEIDPALLKFIQYHDDSESCLFEVLNRVKRTKNLPSVLTLSLIQNGVSSSKANRNAPISSKESSLFLKNVKRSRFHSNVIIYKDPTGRSFSTGQVEDFSNHFLLRYQMLKTILRQRPEARNAISISRIKFINNSEIGIIGMIRSKVEKQSRSISLELEDETGRIVGIISSKEQELLKKAVHLLNDQVIYCKGQKWNSSSFQIKDFFWPDVPFNKQATRITEDINVVLTSDTHVGSKTFLEKKFQRFIDWLNGKIGTSQEKDIALSVKYLIIAGDIVDGIGVYKNQENDLYINDINQQYEKVASYLTSLPEDLTIIMIPGGAHDAVRKALPQPAIPKKHARDLYEMKNVIMLGNPCFFSIHGVDFLVYHGEGLDDVIPVIPGLSYENPCSCMKEFLKSRHLAPCYGTKTSIIPEKEDFMVIDRVPNVLHCGHAHVSDYVDYRGVKLINSGCWQGLTSFQKERGITPTPAKISILNLKTLKTQFIQF